MNIETLFNGRKIIPVVTIERMEDCERIFGGLSDGGLLAAERSSTAGSAAGRSGQGRSSSSLPGFPRTWRCFRRRRMFPIFRAP